MQVRLMVERGQDEYLAKLGGKAYSFKRNEHGHLVAEITDLPTIEWITDPRNTAFQPYSPPEANPSVSTEEGEPVLAAESEIPLSDAVFDEHVPGFSEGGAPEAGKVAEGAASSPKGGGAQDADLNTGSGFECTICHKTFEKAGQLQGHMGGAHRPERN